MPIKPKTVKRPWIHQPDYNSMQGQGRKVINPFYQSIVWKRFRMSYKKREPLCRECKKRNIFTPVYCVDHIKAINPLNAYDTMNGLFGDPLSEGNVQSLCESCHNKKSAKERHGK